MSKHTLYVADHHCHISKEYFNDPIAEIKAIQNDTSLEFIATMGVNFENNCENLHYKSECKDGFLKIGLGLHPAEIIELGEQAYREYTKIESLIRENLDRIDYIGEIGIDFTYPNAQESRIRQIELFRKFCLLSRELHIPVSIHARGAMKEVLDVVQDVFDTSYDNGFLHCFTGTFEDAKRCLKHGLKLGIGGIITFKKSDDLRNVLHAIVAEYPEYNINDLIGLETDTPYLSPVPIRSKTNNPRNIKIIAEYCEQLINQK